MYICHGELMFSGVMKPGVNAIMGPSGAGKSTLVFLYRTLKLVLASCMNFRLLDILAKRRFPSSPDSLILLNGKPLPDNYNLISGYVIQVRLFTCTCMLFDASRHVERIQMHVYRSS